MNEIPYQEILKRLDLIAVQLGTTAGKLWPVLIKQQISSAYAVIIGCVIAVSILWWITLSFKKRMIKEWVSVTQANSSAEYPSLQVVFIICVIISIITTWVAFCSILTNILVILNPEYHALQELASFMQNQKW